MFLQNISNKFVVDLKTASVLVHIVVGNYDGVLIGCHSWILEILSWLDPTPMQQDHWVFPGGSAMVAQRIHLQYRRFRRRRFNPWLEESGGDAALTSNSQEES